MAATNSSASNLSTLTLLCTVQPPPTTRLALTTALEPAYGAVHWSPIGWQDGWRCVITLMKELSPQRKANIEQFVSGPDGTIEAESVLGKFFQKHQVSIFAAFLSSDHLTISTAELKHIHSLHSGQGEEVARLQFELNEYKRMMEGIHKNAESNAKSTPTPIAKPFRLWSTIPLEAISSKSETKPTK